MEARRLYGQVEALASLQDVLDDDCRGKLCRRLTTMIYNAMYDEKIDEEEAKKMINRLGAACAIGATSGEHKRLGSASSDHDSFDWKKDAMEAAHGMSESQHKAFVRKIEGSSSSSNHGSAESARSRWSTI